MSDPTPAPISTMSTRAYIWDQFKTILMGIAIGIAIMGQTHIPGPSPSPIPPIPSPIPVPPAPVPIPPPAPPVPPVPAWGPLDKILIMYESSKLSGKEAFFAQPVRDALNQAATADPTTRLPNWRIWDQNVDASADPGWSDALAKAKAAFTSPSDPVLFAFDGQGRVKTVPLKGLSDADAATAIKALGGK